MSDLPHPSGYENSDADPRLIAALAAGIAIFLILVPAILVVGYPEAPRMGGVPLDLPKPPAPRLQVHPKTDLARLRAEERDRLQNPGWVDHERRIVRIPIGRAMKVLEERGLSGWPSTNSASH